MDTIYMCSVDEVMMGALVFLKPVQAIYSYSKLPLVTNLVLDWQLTESCETILTNQMF